MLMRNNRNNINVFPHSTFNWVGIDGTQVLCHMTPVGAYLSLLQSFLPVWTLISMVSGRRYVYGAGDGGGCAEGDPEP